MKLFSIIFASLFFVNSFFLNEASANPFIIRNDVDAALRNMKFSGRHDFDVTVKSNVVTIEGFVSNLDDKARVERAAYSVNGVSLVKNNLTIVGASAISTSNTSKVIRDRIKADPSIKNYSLEIEHEGNSITITGEVEAQSDKEKIFQIAYSIAPDANIQNNLAVRDPGGAPDFEVNEKVVSALRSQGSKGLETVVIDTKDGIVHFKGTVKNHREIDQMLSTALMIEGVKSVRSDVKVAN